MENAADALKMAAAVLIFIVSLSISINSFSEVRKTSQTLLNYQDREYDQTYVNELKDASGNSITERIVGAESIIPTIYKAYRENYKIVFTESALSDGLYKKNGEKVYRLDLENTEGTDVIFPDDAAKERFIKVLLNGNPGGIEDISVFENQGITFNADTLYNEIKTKYFKESLGQYYQEDLYTGAETADVNKTPKRVITYSDI